LLKLVVGHPLFAVCLTVLAYGAADVIWRRSGGVALLCPVLVATIFVASALTVLDIPYEDYMRQAHLINDALSVVIVLLAVPLYRHFRIIQNVWAPLSFALLIGVLVAKVIALILPLIMGAGQDLLATIVPSSATMAVGVELSTRFGGIPGLTAIVVISSGILGGTLGPPMLDAVGVRDDRARGFALGVAAHGIGTARAFMISDAAGTFACIGMILNAILTVLLVPLLLMGV
jgi:predicted murein hydrolase (TIGR00659 family)